jgi:tRNA(His) guanylyltransferase
VANGELTEDRGPKDPLGDRMKAQYEDRTRFFLPRRTYTILRLDGRAFHTLTDRWSLDRPWDIEFMRAMDDLAMGLCKEVAGSVFGYVQSDEISILMQDFESVGTQPWFGGNIQKIVSVAASFAGNSFGWQSGSGLMTDATFDARVFTIADQVEVANYFLWRQQDARRNAVAMVTEDLFGAKRLQGVSTRERLALLEAANYDWADVPQGFQNGRVVFKEVKEIDAAGNQRTWWNVAPAPELRCDGWLVDLIPAMPRLT